MKNYLFFALLMIFYISIMTSCTADKTVAATVVSSPTQNFADRVLGFYSCDVVTDCGDTTSVWLTPEKRFLACQGKKVEFRDNGMTRKPIIDKVL